MAHWESEKKEVGKWGRCEGGLGEIISGKLESITNDVQFGGIYSKGMVSNFCHFDFIQFSTPGCPLAEYAEIAEYL